MSDMINALYLRIRGMMVSRWGMTEGRIMRTHERKVSQDIKSLLAYLREKRRNHNLISNYIQQGNGRKGTMK